MLDFRHFFNYPIWAVFLLTVTFFSCLYFGFAFFGLYLSRRFFPMLKIGAPIELEALGVGQRGREIRASLYSIVTFGILTLITREAIALKWVAIVWTVRWEWLPLEIAALILINEVHFYFCHRLLHTKWLYRNIHFFHHRSTVPTPFSTYSFHFVEAFLLGSVMLTAMFLYNFSFLALFSLPFFSIFANMIGHLHYDLFPDRSSNFLLAFSKRHSLHHSKISGNFGFLFTGCDLFFGTSIYDCDASALERERTITARG